jgi:hypothetical protein
MILKTGELNIALSGRRCRHSNRGAHTERTFEATPLFTTSFITSSNPLESASAHLRAPSLLLDC